MPDYSKHLPRYRGLFLVAFLLSCSDDPTEVVPETSSPSVLETGRTVKSTIGPTGGSIVVSDSRRKQYTLTVPAGALLRPVEIAVTPVRSIDGLGLQGPLVGAVDLQPRGLELAQAASLHMRAVDTLSAGLQLVGFTAKNDLSKRALTLAASGVEEVVVLVPHFSIAGAALAKPERIENFSTPQTDPIDRAFDWILALPLPWGPSEEQIARGLISDVFSAVVEPRLQHIDTDELLFEALTDHYRWRFMLAVMAHHGEVPPETIPANTSQLDVPVAFEDEANRALTNTVVALQDAIMRGNARCASGETSDAVNAILFWERQAHLLGVDTPENQLDHDTIHERLCARLIVDEFEIPPTLSGPELDSLVVSVRMQVDGQDIVDAPPFAVTVQGELCQVDNPNGVTDDEGMYTIVYRRDGGPISALTVTACFTYPGTGAPSALCASRTSTPPAFNLGGAYIGTGPLDTEPTYTTVFIYQSQGFVSGTFRSIGKTTVHSGSFRALVDAISVRDVSVELSNCPLQSANPTLSAIENGDQTTIFLSVDGVDCDGLQLGTLQACGPNSRIQDVDLSGDWEGAITLADSGELPISATVTGGFGHICGTISGQRSGAFCSDIVITSNVGYCMGTLNGFEISFSDCPLTPGTRFEYGCVDYADGVMTISLTTDAGWIDGCTGNELVGFRLSREMDICTGATARNTRAPSTPRP